MLNCFQRLEWIDNKVVAADERTDRNLRLDAAIRADNKVRALQRQKKAERYRRLIRNSYQTTHCLEINSF